MQPPAELEKKIIRSGMINVSVSNLYDEPSYGSELISQGILGEQVEILKHHQPFTRIRQMDGYESWISSEQVVLGVVPEGRRIMVRSHFMRIYREPSISSESVRDVVIGSVLLAEGEEKEWVRIVLPDMTAGWAEKRHFGTFPEFSVESITALAREFLGYQYAWGGRSPKGFDCSGFVQTIFNLHGVAISRDAEQQQRSHIYSTDYCKAEAADLLFFGKSAGYVTHVAISLGNQRFIHASGWIRCNSLNKTDRDFSEHHQQTSISVNRYGH